MISIPFYCIVCWLDEQSFDYFLSNVSTLSYWFYHNGAWYVAMLIPLYLVTPCLVSILSNKYSWIHFILLTLLCYSCAAYYHVNPPAAYGIEHNISFVIFRLPSYFLGITIAPYIQTEYVISRTKTLIILISSLAIGVVLYRYHLPFEMFIAILIIGFCSLILSGSSKFIIKTKKYLNKLGKVSLESYLFNIFLPLLLIRINWDYISPNINRGNYLMYIITVILGCALSFGINQIVEIINNDRISKTKITHEYSKEDNRTSI